MWMGQLGAALLLPIAAAGLLEEERPRECRDGVGTGRGGGRKGIVFHATPSDC